MFLPKSDSEYFYGRAKFFSTGKLHALDKYWSKNCSHPIHQQIHEIIESILIQRGEQTMKEERLNLLKNLEKSFLISNPMGRFSANIIGLITKLLVSINFMNINK